MQSMDFPGPNEHTNYKPSKINGSGGMHHSHELEVNPSTKSTKFKIIRKLRSASSPSKLRLATDSPTNAGNIMTEKSSSMDQDAVLEMQENGEGSSRSTSYEKNKLYNYGTGSVIEQHDSHAIDSHALQRDLSEASGRAICRTRSMKTKATLEEPDTRACKLKVRVNQASKVPSKKLERSSMRACDQLQAGESASSSRVGARSRSGRSKRYGGSDNNPDISAAKKSNNVCRKLSWLMLSEHEEGYRYIPQLGDEVVYIRQGHQEFVENQGLAELGPWKSHKDSLRAVEICKVEQLDYATYPGSGESCCKITLKFVDPKSRVSGITFKFPVPLYPEQIRLRLVNNYYRNFEAVEHDVEAN
ncbi:uncharacterized protein LOC110819537 [Carica papaya]|uniref:uncharacterized protein LOC110819537 n=1 Tax=Carica papaya TaxID=3649 RepID=UPI000B8C8861|nr:uncharacterized protein LOC110819537 [Carica papaya]